MSVNQVHGQYQDQNPLRACNPYMKVTRSLSFVCTLRSCSLLVGYDTPTQRSFSYVQRRKTAPEMKFHFKSNPYFSIIRRIQNAFLIYGQVQFQGRVLGLIGLGNPPYRDKTDGNFNWLSIGIQWYSFTLIIDGYNGR